jgi:hypothetical protein
LNIASFHIFYLHQKDKIQYYGSTARTKTKAKPTRSHKVSPHVQIHIRHPHRHIQSPHTRTHIHTQGKTKCQTGYATTTSRLSRTIVGRDGKREDVLTRTISFQGRGGMGRGAQRGGSSSQRGGGRHGGPQGPQPTLDKPKREAILDLAKYANARIRVKFTGGREGMCPLSPLSLSCFNPADDLITRNQ